MYKEKIKLYLKFSVNHILIMIFLFMLVKHIKQTAHEN